MMRTLSLTVALCLSAALAAPAAAQPETGPDDEPAPADDTPGDDDSPGDTDDPVDAPDLDPVPDPTPTAPAPADPTPTPTPTPTPPTELPTRRDHRDQDSAAGSEDAVILDRVVAVVNDDIVLRSELMARVLPMIADLDQIQDPRERQRRRRQLTEQIMQEMINETLMVQAAKESGLSVEQKEIVAALEEIKKQNDLDDEGLEQALAMQGYTMSAYKKDVRKQILRMRAVNSLVRPKVKISEEDVRARYDEMSRRSASVSKVRLQHVLIELPESPGKEQMQAAKERAAEVIQRARAGEDFGALAREYSDDAETATDGGDLGWIERGSIATEWEVIVFSMDEGEVRGPISGPQGLHVFHVSALDKSELESFEKKKEEIRQELYRKKMDRKTREWLEELRKSAYVETKL